MVQFTNRRNLMLTTKPIAINVDSRADNPAH